MDEHLDQPQDTQQDQSEQGQIPLDPHQLNVLMHEIDDYNTQFSWGATVARFVSRSLHQNEVGEGSQPPDHIAEEQESQAVTAASIEAAHTDTLAALGLSLEPVAGKSFTVYTGEGQIGTGEIRVNIADGGRFLGFLGSLTPESAHETTVTHSLARLSDILSRQVLDSYDLRNPSPEAIELLGRLGRISEEYRRLGVEGSGVDRFEAYLAHSRAMDLREYVAIEQQGLMQEPGKFGPADWQKDANVEFLQRKWTGALNTLDMARQNPHSGTLYESLGAHLRKCVVEAQGFLASHPDYYGPTAMAEMAATLEQARQHLE